MCTEEQHAEEMAAFAALQARLDLLIRGRTPIDTFYNISTETGVILDYKGRKHIFLWTANALTLTINALGTLSVAAEVWTNLDFTVGLTLFSSSATPQMILIRCTDELLSAPGSSTVAVSSLPALPAGTNAVGTVGVTSLPALPAGTNAIGSVSVSSFPSTPGTPITASTTGAAAAATTATLAAATGVTTYITGFTVIAGAVTSEVEGVVTITGTVSGTLSYRLNETVAAGGVINIVFPQPVPASAADTAIVVNVPAITGGGATSTVATGFQA